MLADEDLVAFAGIDSVVGVCERLCFFCSVGRELYSIGGGFYSVSSGLTGGGLERGKAQQAWDKCPETKEHNVNRFGSCPEIRQNLCWMQQGYVILTSIYLPEGIFACMNTLVVSKAMIFAAGLGTRFKPWTDHHPKALALVNGKSLLQRNIEYLQQYGIRDVIVNVHHFADQIIDTLKANKGWGSTIAISDETEEVLETGGGLIKARPLLDGEPFVAMNVDILTDLDLGLLIRDHFQYRPLATLAVTGRETSRYFLFDEAGCLRGWRNVKTGQERWAGTKPDGPTITPKAFSGIHVIDPALFPLMQQKGKFSMVDVYLEVAATHTVRGFDHSGSRLIDVGKPESAELAGKMFG
jgi:UTP-glucose-1-phosphate uridylyltransferase